MIAINNAISIVISYGAISLIQMASAAGCGDVQNNENENTHQKIEISTEANESGLNFCSANLQSTFITQQKNNFKSPYYGTNSLLNNREGGAGNSYSFSTTGFFGIRLGRIGEFYYNPEIFEGIPFNKQLVGLGGFQNGELQKGAFEQPVFYNARAFYRYTFSLGGSKEQISSRANQLNGNVDSNRLVVTFGKVATLDYFDQNSFSHDPRTQFQNFSLFSMGAYGYAADTKGYTYGAIMELYHEDWIFKSARLALPYIPNTQKLDYSLRSDYIDQIELTHKHELWSKPGAIRGLYYKQSAYMGDYNLANSQAQLNNTVPIIAMARKETKSWGYGINIEQSIREDLGVFGRWSWNPGNIETQTIDISRSLTAGIQLTGISWKRPNDMVGVGVALNGLARSQIKYLQEGGISPFIGDGALQYKKEHIFEMYYSYEIYKKTYLTIDFQNIENPAYNSNRGPANILGMRAHIEI